MDREANAHTELLAERCWPIELANTGTFILYLKRLKI